MSAVLRLIEGGGEGTPSASCTVCGIPGHEPAACKIVARHVRWLELKGRAERTRYHRRWTVLRMAETLPVPAVDATREHLLAWRAGLRLADASVLCAVSHVSEFYRYLVDEEGIIPASPAVRIPVPKRPRGLPRPIAEADLLALLGSAPKRVRPWLVLAAWAGLRCCEVARIRGEDFVLDGPRPVLRVTAEAAKGGRPRVVPLSPFVVAEMRAAGLPARGYAFARVQGAGPLSPSAVSHGARRALRDAGLPEGLHSLRHYALSKAWAGSHNLLAVSRLAGHASVATTTVYTKLDDLEVVEAVNSIPAPPDGPAG